LVQAKASDLSGAASLLQKSVRINKINVQAYNLLGLVQFEMGRIGDAVKNWVISSNRSQENNPATGYIEQLNKNSSMLEKYSDAVKMYNNALTYLKQKSDDLAIIQLKKAIEVNPKFVDALNLLTLCYLIQSERDKASQLIDKVLTVDAHNTIALNYYSELHPGRRPIHRAYKSPGTVTPVVTRATPPPEPAFKQAPVAEKKRVSFHFGIIIAFVLGVACTFAVFQYMMIPALEQEAIQQQSTRELDFTAAEQELLLQIKGKNDEIAGYDERIAGFQAEIESLNAQTEFQLVTNRILQAYNLFTDGRLQEAVDTAQNLDVAGQPPDIAERYQRIFTDSYPTLAQQYFDSGDAAFQAEDYAKALVDLKLCEAYIADDAEYRGWLIARLGICYAQEEATKDLAVEYLTEYVTNYPTQGMVNRATDLLEDLTED
jgi:tetratricopeptide (TPR) repeat protein